MHLYWVTMAAVVHAMGDPSVDWMLEDAARGEVFAAGHGEAGNDLPVLYSTTRAERVDGGYRVNGRKFFVSLAGAATYYATPALLIAEGPWEDRTLYLQIPAEAPGLEVTGEWDPLGMRGTVSRDLTLRDVWVPAEAATVAVAPAAASEPAAVCSKRSRRLILLRRGMRSPL